MATSHPQVVVTLATRCSQAHCLEGCDPPAALPHSLHSLPSEAGVRSWGGGGGTCRDAELREGSGQPISTTDLIGSTQGSSASLSSAASYMGQKVAHRLGGEGRECPGLQKPHTLLLRPPHPMSLVQDEPIGCWVHARRPRCRVKGEEQT